MKADNKETSVEQISLDEKTALVVGLASEVEDPDCSLDQAITFAKERRKQWVRKNTLTA